MAVLCGWTFGPREPLPKILGKLIGRSQTTSTTNSPLSYKEKWRNRKKRFVGTCSANGISTTTSSFAFQPELWLDLTMPAKIATSRGGGWVKQFSVFTANRLGRLHDLVGLFSSHEVHVLALTVLDTTDSAIIRLVVDDPEQARSLMLDHGFPHTESDLMVVELDSTTQLSGLMAALLEAEININYIYSFIPHPRGKSLLAFNMEDNEMAEQVLRRHQFHILKQADISR
jgi:hypothetical protein